VKSIIVIIAVAGIINVLLIVTNSVAFSLFSTLQQNHFTSTLSEQPSHREWRAIIVAKLSD
jgi:hypothetical protein